jgi:thioredoxin-like negative regulator of GroEL
MGHGWRAPVLAAWAIAVLVAGGCGPSRLTRIPDERAFADLVLKAERPVVVEFAKGGCVWCTFLNASMDALVDEYDGRVTFARFELIDMWHHVLSDRLWRRYRVSIFPTVILFVGGQETHRWVADYGAGNYRAVLDTVAGPPAPRPPATQPPASGG